MKTVVKFTVMAALLFHIVIANASEPKLNLVADLNEKSLIIDFDEVSKDTKIQFLDSENYIIYSDNSFKNKSIHTKFDLSNLKAGTYTFKLESLTKTINYDILIQKETIIIKDKVEVIKPAFRVKEDVVYINFLNISKEGVEIKVYDGEDRILYSEKFMDTLTVEKAINFKNANKGEYTVIVKNTHGNYQKSVSI
ncbi:DUF3244 domain-containing protein [Cellulophaga sp. Hel_I_12]|uniref:DUF3244 domain-containing protein n=1 Tax=Cellulophaga sp. Hel_I_12 TaxID=1249972 RepID=UPI00064778A8|nr:DUF3244 domain-containing protein [Cellulophaga sp. Hel_I_12]